MKQMFTLQNYYCIELYLDNDREMDLKNNVNTIYYADSFSHFDQNALFYEYIILTNIMKNNSKSELVKFKPTNETTIAELNKVSIKESKNNLNTQAPLRIRLPQYFNIPSFQDPEIFAVNIKENVKVTPPLQEDVIFKKRMKDLTLLAQGMKRSKNIKEQSRYYFTQGVLLHNSGNYVKSIQVFQKFLKIVIFLQDPKSVELALNVIGCQYMYMREYQKAIQFHMKQGQTSDRSDSFIGYVNTGFCYELIGQLGKSYQYYQKAKESIENSTERLKMIEKLIQRIELALQQSDLFMTENRSTLSKGHKEIQNSILKQEVTLLLKKTSNRKQFEQNKMKYAIYSAQSNIQQHLKSSIKF